MSGPLLPTFQSWLSQYHCLSSSQSITYRSFSGWCLSRDIYGIAERCNRTKENLSKSITSFYMSLSMPLFTLLHAGRELTQEPRNWRQRTTIDYLILQGEIGQPVDIRDTCTQRYHMYMEHDIALEFLLLSFVNTETENHVGSLDIAMCSSHVLLYSQDGWKFELPLWQSSGSPDCPQHGIMGTKRSLWGVLRTFLLCIVSPVLTLACTAYLVRYCSQLGKTGCLLRLDPHKGC